MGKITHNEMTKQNARTAIFTLSERTSETEERLYKESSRALHFDAKFKLCSYLTLFIRVFKAETMTHFLSKIMYNLVAILQIFSALLDEKKTF